MSDTTDTRGFLLRHLAGLRLWLLCVVAVGLSAWLLRAETLDAVTYATIISAALYAFAGRDGLVQATEKYSDGKARVAEATRSPDSTSGTDPGTSEAGEA